MNLESYQVLDYKPTRLPLCLRSEGLAIHKKLSGRSYMWLLWLVLIAIAVIVFAPEDTLL